VRWGLAIIFPFAVVLWLLSLVFAPGDPDVLTIRVISQVTGEAIDGATVIVDEARYITDEDGTIRIDPMEPGTHIAVSASGYETMGRDLNADHHGDLTFSLSGILVMGALTDAVSGEPVAGATISAIGRDGEKLATSRTDDGGGFVFKLIPEDARLEIVDEIYGASVHPIGDSRIVSIPLDPPPVRGRVVDQAGLPVGEATVSDGQARVTSGPDGAFTLDPVGQGSEVEVSADGHGATTILIEGTDLGDLVLAAPSATPAASTGGGA
jgi:hypothetical protein